MHRLATRMGTLSQRERRELVRETSTLLDQAIQERAPIPQDRARVRAVVSAAAVVAAAHEGDKPTATRRMDRLLNYLMSNFHGDVSVEDVRRVATHERVAPSAVPVVVMSQLLTRFQVVLDMSKVPSWNGFVQRYGAAILQA